MKKVFTFFAAVALSVGAFAQQTPNGGFEAWTSPSHPDFWSTYGNITGFPGGGNYPYFATKDMTAGNFVEGTASLKLITDTINAGPAGYLIVPSIAALGPDLSYTSGHGIVSSGIAYTKRIDTIYLSYKYSPARAIDTASLTFDLTKAGASLFPGTLGALLPNTNGNWQNNIALAITPRYTSGNTPDTLRLMFFSSSYTGAPADTGAFRSTLWVDAIHFNAAVTINGVEELNGKILGVNVYPNPASAQLNVKVEADEIGSQVQLFDITGREVYNGTIEKATFAIDTKNFENGVYTIRVNSIDKMTTYNGKVSISH